jgi:Holliday junction resolvase RusA-like endonuclease
MKLQIKPLSVNEVWQGRRFKTKKYDKYISDVCFILPNIELPPGPYCLVITFGFSNVQSDIDNGLKPFIDCLQKKYKFNDKLIYKLIVTKEIVSKGNEFVDFEIFEL